MKVSFFITGLLGLILLSCDKDRNLICTFEYPSLTGFLDKITNNPDCADLNFVQWEINRVKKAIDEFSKNNVSPQDRQAEIDRMKGQIDTLSKIISVAADQIRLQKRIQFEPLGTFSGTRASNLADIDRLNKQLDSLKRQIKQL